MSGRYDRCLRCRKGVPWGQSVCRDCNPAALQAPSPVQYHATVFISVLVIIAAMAVTTLLLR